MKKAKFNIGDTVTPLETSSYFEVCSGVSYVVVDTEPLPRFWGTQLEMCLIKAGQTRKRWVFSRLLRHTKPRCVFENVP